MIESIVAQIATTSNIAVLVLVAGCIALYKMLIDDRKLERDARKEDAKHCAEATNRQTEAVIELTKVLTELRLDTAKHR